MCEPRGLPLEKWKDTALIRLVTAFIHKSPQQKHSVMTIGTLYIPFSKKMGKGQCTPMQCITIALLFSRKDLRRLPTEAWVNVALMLSNAGDQQLEHIALDNAARMLQRCGLECHPKCIKYVESPSLEALTRQTLSLTDLLDRFADEESGTYLMQKDEAV